MIIKKETQDELNARQKKILFSIKKQFDIFRKKGISTEHIKAICRLPDEEKRNLGFLRIQIIDDKLYAEHHVASTYPGSSKLACNNIIKRLVRIVKTHKIHNIDFIFLTIDNISNISQESESLIEDFPAFMSSKNVESTLEKNKLLLPDPYILDNEKWPSLINQINEASKTYSWDKKIEKIFWRGATTGNMYNLENYHKLYRLTLVMLSRSFPDLIDAKFVDYANFSNNQSGIHLYNILIRLFDNPGKLAETEHLKHKYLISIDGNTAAWLRVPWILLSNSILLKPKTAFTQMFYDALEPYINYIPLKKDLSDIFEKLEWLKTNDDKAEIISNNATALSQKALMPNDFDNYIATTLNEYHLLQNFKLQNPTLQSISQEFSF